ncbi:MAG: hypothetical protein MJZ05_12505 [Fibrobacter sp.]|nr:hypothetical protein [Fibrobacter sp.]
MQRLSIIVTILTLLLSIEVCAQRYNDFAGIPFGASRETVIEEVMKLGYEPYGQRGEGERVVIPVFMFGELPVQVDFIFNKNDKFYSFEIRTGRVERARLSKSFEAVDYMSEQFTLKYGKASGAPAISETSNLRENVLNIYQQWYAVKVLNVCTALVQKGGRYFAVGSVTHRTLATEKSAKGGKSKDKAASSRPVF